MDDMWVRIILTQRFTTQVEGKSCSEQTFEKRKTLLWNFYPRDSYTNAPYFQTERQRSANIFELL